MRYVVAYDISDDTLRTRIAKELSAFGARVQESVFECDLGDGDLDELMRRLQRALDPPEAGSIRVYRLCLDCLRAARGLGVIAPGRGDEACLVI